MCVSTNVEDEYFLVVVRGYASMWGKSIAAYTGMTK